MSAVLDRAAPMGLDKWEPEVVFVPTYEWNSPSGKSSREVKRTGRRCCMTVFESEREARAYTASKGRSPNKVRDMVVEDARRLARLNDADGVELIVLKDDKWTVAKEWPV